MEPRRHQILTGAQSWSPSPRLCGTRRANASVGFTSSRFLLFLILKTRSDFPAFVVVYSLFLQVISEYIGLKLSVLTHWALLDIYPILFCVYAVCRGVYDGVKHIGDYFFCLIFTFSGFFPSFSVLEYFWNTYWELPLDNLGCNLVSCHVE